MAINTNAARDKQRVLEKLRFIEDRLESLNSFLPETYEYLIKELDQQNRLLAEIEIKECFAGIDLDQEETYECQ
jgi:hypothetical protein